MIRSSLIISFLVVFFLGACKQAKNENETSPSQMEEVMAIHDEVMPKMGKIGSLVAELKSIADTTAAGSEYHKAMEDLQAAHESMMTWMKGFGDRFDSEEILQGKELTKEKQQWLDEEEVKVKAMREQIYGSIERAEKLLNN